MTPEERLVAYADKRLKGDRVVSMERELARSFALPHRSRRRMYRLWREMDVAYRIIRRTCGRERSSSTTPCGRVPSTITTSFGSSAR